MALNNKKKITESEDIVEHSADLVFEIYTSDIAKHGGYTGSFNALAKEISDAGLQITGKRDSNGTKMIITASGPEECEALESVLTDNGLEPDFVDFVMNNPLQHDGMNFEQAEESFESVKSPFLRSKILESVKGDGCGCDKLDEGWKDFRPMNKEGYSRFGKVPEMFSIEFNKELSKQASILSTQSGAGDLKKTPLSISMSKKLVRNIVDVLARKMFKWILSLGKDMDSRDVVALLDDSRASMKIADAALRDVARFDRTPSKEEIVSVRDYADSVVEDMKQELQKTDRWVPRQSKGYDDEYPDFVGESRVFESFSKAQREKMAEEGLAMKDGSFPIRNKADLKKAIQSIGRAKDEAKAKAWIKKRAKALGCSDMIPEEWSKKKINESYEAMPGEYYVQIVLEEYDGPEEEALLKQISRETGLIPKAISADGLNSSGFIVDKRTADKIARAYGIDSLNVFQFVDSNVMQTEDGQEVYVDFISESKKETGSELNEGFGENVGNYYVQIVLEEYDGPEAMEMLDNIAKRFAMSPVTIQADGLISRGFITDQATANRIARTYGLEPEMVFEFVDNDVMQATTGEEVYIDSISESKKPKTTFKELYEAKKDKEEKVCSPFGKVKVNGKKLCECGKGELRQMLREAKQELKELKKKEKSLGESASKRDKNKLATSIKKAEKLCEILEEEIKFNPKKVGAVNEAQTLWAEFTKWAKLYEGEDDDKEEEEKPADEETHDGDEDSKKEDDAEEAELEAIVLTVKDTEKVKKNLIDAGIPEEHIEVIPDNEKDEESKEGKLRIDADDALTLKDYLSGLGIDLEEEIGAEIVDDSKADEEEPEEGEDKKDDDTVDDSNIEATAEDIFGEK